jgi:predicted deacetylase
MPNHINEGVTYAFLDRVLSRLGDMIEIFIKPTYEISCGVSKVL